MPVATSTHPRTCCAGWSASTSSSARGADVPTDDERFRAELRSWLVEHEPPAIEVAATREEADVLREWQRVLHSGRWVGIDWPAEYGGRGASLTQVAVYNEELA